MSIVLQHLSKIFGGQCVVNDVSLEVADGELFVLLGPSGSGKSTVLRMIAGLLEIDEGFVFLHGRDVTHLFPQKRDIGFVFQHYALFRHMTVAENIEFPLKIRKGKPAERRRRRDELLEIVGLVGFERRFPHQLSGGQQQRIALARALAHRPGALLLDEPFGALDAKIRADLRRSLRRIQQELRVTTVFVTHDQEEAFELGDRIGVMNYGRLLEVGPPTELYLRPQTEFVASFLGKANLLVGECAANSVALGPVRIPLDHHVTSRGGDRRVQVLFRPEDVAVAESLETLPLPVLGRGIVDEAGFAGSLERIRLRIPSLRGVRAIAPEAPFGADFVLVEATRSQHEARRFPLQPGDSAWVGIRRIHALTHPGLSLLLATDGSLEDSGALELCGQIARLAHARVTVLGIDRAAGRGRAALETARERIGSGPASLELRASPDDLHAALEREAGRHSFDLAILGCTPGNAVEVADRALDAWDHHLLLVPNGCAVPRNVLVCVAIGEPGKNDVQFAGRLVRHLGAAATLLTVLPEHCSASTRAHGERFLEAGIRTLSILGVRGASSIRIGRTREQILAAVKEGGHDLLVLGAPAGGRHGRTAITGIVRDLLAQMREIPTLIVRSPLALPEIRSLPVRRAAVGLG